MSEQSARLLIAFVAWSCEQQKDGSWLAWGRSLDGMTTGRGRTATDALGALLGAL